MIEKSKELSTYRAYLTLSNFKSSGGHVYHHMNKKSDHNAGKILQLSLYLDEEKKIRTKEILYKRPQLFD